MTPQQFIDKWKLAELKERAACQEHFLNLCAVLCEPTPAEADPSGEWYTFEKSVVKDTGGKGFADVWRRGCFAWEYKGKRKNLSDAYQQLCQYREALGNPPLLIVCDLNRFEIHTNFTGTAKEVHAFDLDGLADPATLIKLRYAFTKPEELKPGHTQEEITKDAANKFAAVADGMRERNIEPHRAGHFLMKLMFCMFAEDMDLLPRDLFLKTIKNTRWDSKKLSKLLSGLFEAMANKDGSFGADEIAWFNGGLFKDADVIELTPTEIRHLAEAAEFDWSNVEPSIFGTLFERILNPEKRSQLGAHYTSREDIITLVEPVMMAPLRREWATVKEKADTLWVKAKGSKAGSKPKRDFETCVVDFLDRLAHVTVLDPACGSGNFLYVSLHLLLDLEKEALTYASVHAINRFPFVRPTQLHGIEINAYAQELAQVVIWIGYLQWMKFNGFNAPSNPVLDPMDSIENRDAILDLTDPANPKEPDWPDAEFIVGNPPFLGDKKMRGELGDSYVNAVRKLYDGRLPGGSDLVCYWFEKARAMIKSGKLKRAGLIATQGIRGGSNRACLDRIKETGDIFFAYSDRDWVLDGATVHVSMVGFDDQTESAKQLNGVSVETIHSDLKAGNRPNMTTAKLLLANASLCFLGVMKAGPFDIDEATALKWLQDANPNGRPNSDVLRPRLTARDILQRAEVGWIIDFGCDSSMDSMAMYAAPWNHVETKVKPNRLINRRKRLADRWWIHGEARPGLRRSSVGITRFIVTPEVSKHRVFSWLDDVYLADHQTRAFTNGTDDFFGILHSKIHEAWARAKGTQLRDVESGFRYTPTTCFETFPFPEPTPAQREAIGAAAKELDTLRNNWCNPPEWVRTEVLQFPGSVDGPWKRYVSDPDSRGIGTVRYPRLVPKDAVTAASLKNRTLTKLYNERPTWLANAHRKLDDAVFAAYGWPANLSDDDLLAKLLALNLSRAGSEATGDTEEEDEAE